MWTKGCSLAELTPPDKRLAHNQLAAVFDQTMYRYDLDRRLAVLVDEFLSDMDLTGHLALEAGCGTGHGTARLLGRGAKTVAMDIGPELVRRTRQRARGCLPVVGDITACPFRSDAFSVVLSTEVIEHTYSPEAAVAECCRVLRPGGRLVLSTPNKAWHWAVRLADLLGVRPYGALENFLSPGELRRALLASGCVVVRHVGLHILPFQIRALHGVLRFVDRWGAVLLPLMINQCVQAVKEDRPRA